MKPLTVLSFCLAASPLPAAEFQETNAPAPMADRIKFPEGYAQSYQVLRVVNKPDEKKVVTIYGNQPAATVTNSAQLPYPYGSIIVMETAAAMKDDQGKAVVDQRGNLRKDKVTGLHVMRREKGFGEAYGKNRAGEWEYVEYRPDGSYQTPPQKSASCAECHVKAGQQRDFVYRGRLPEKLVQ